MYGKYGAPGEFFVRPFNLGNEMNLAVWWSGVQFLWFALLACSLATALRGTDKVAARALLALGFVGFAMFADEIGSFHERVSLFVPFEGDFALLPFAVVGGALAAYGIRGLFSRRELLGRAWLLVLYALGLLASVYLHEFAGRRFHWAFWTEGIRLVAEEGTELAGVFLLLVAMVHIQRRLGYPSVRLLPAREPVIWATKWCVALALPVIVVRCAMTSEQLAFPIRGDFGSVIPMFLFAISASIAVERGQRDRGPRHRWWILAGALTILSMDAEVRIHHYILYGAEALRWRPEIGLLWGVPLIAAAAASVPALRRRKLYLYAGAAFALVLIAVVVSNPFLSWVTTYLVAFASVALLHRWGGERLESMKCQPARVAV